MMAYTKEAGGRSLQVKWDEGFDPANPDESIKRTTFHEEEFDATKVDLVRAKVEALLKAGTCRQVSVVRWMHERNLPRCLPEIRSSSLSLTIYSLVNGEVVERPVDIHGMGY